MPRTSSQCPNGCDLERYGSHATDCALYGEKRAAAMSRRQDGLMHMRTESNSALEQLAQAILDERVSFVYQSPGEYDGRARWHLRVAPPE